MAEPGEAPAAPQPAPLPPTTNDGGGDERTPSEVAVVPAAVPSAPIEAVNNSAPEPEISEEVDVATKKSEEVSGACDKVEQPAPPALAPEAAGSEKPVATPAKPSNELEVAAAGTLGTTSAPSHHVKRKAMSGLMARLAKPKARRRSNDGSEPASSSGAPAATARPNPTAATATSGGTPAASAPPVVPPPAAVDDPAPAASEEDNREAPSSPIADKTEAEPVPSAASREPKLSGKPGNVPPSPANAKPSSPGSSQEKGPERDGDEMSDQDDDYLGEDGAGNAPLDGSLAGSSSDGARGAVPVAVRKRTPSAVAKAAAETEAEVARARATGIRGRGKGSKGPRRGTGGRGRGSKASSKATSAQYSGDKAGGIAGQKPSAKSSKKAGGGGDDSSGDGEDEYEESGGDQGAGSEDNSKQRKSYVSTKTREVWSTEEHERFIEAVEKFGRKWKSVAEYVNTRTPVQIRSHAQKYYNKLTREGNQAVIPPPRRKRKPQPPSQPSGGQPLDSQPLQSQSGPGTGSAPSPTDQDAVVSKPAKTQKRSTKASPAAKRGASEKAAGSQNPGVEGTAINDVMGLPNEEELKDWGPQGSFGSLPGSGSMGMGIEMDMAMGMEMGIDMRLQQASQQPGMPPQGSQQQPPGGSRMIPGSSQQPPGAQQPPQQQQQMTPRGMMSGEQQTSPAGEESCALPPVVPMGPGRGHMMHASMGGPGYDGIPRMERGPMDRQMMAMEGMDRRGGSWESMAHYGGQGGRYPPAGWGDERGGGGPMTGGMDELGEMMDPGAKGQPMGPQGGGPDGGPGISRQQYMARMGYSDVDSDQSMGSRWPMAGNGSPMYGPSGMYGGRPMGMRGHMRDPGMGYPRGMEMAMMGGPGSYRGMMEDVSGPRGGGGMGHHMGYGYMDGLRGMEMESRMYRGKMMYGPGPERGIRGPPDGPRGMGAGMGGFKGGRGASGYDHETSPNYSHDEGMPMGGMPGRGGDMYMDQMAPPHGMQRGRRGMYESGGPPPYAGGPQQHWRYMQSQGQRLPPEMQGKGVMGASASPTEGEQYQGGSIPGEIPPGRAMYESPSFQQPMNSGGGGMAGIDGPPMPGPGRQDPQAWNDQHPQDGGGPPPDQVRYRMYPMNR